MKIHERVQRAMAGDQQILATFGIEVVQASDGLCEMSAIVPGSLINAAGFAHGSVAFSLLDTACAYALSSQGARGVTLNANVSYIRGCHAADQLRARTQVVSQTSRVATLRGELFVQGQTSVLAAHGSFVFQLIRD